MLTFAAKNISNLKNPLVIGTRGSDLALWQAHHVKNLLESNGVACVLHIIKTKGDQIQNLSFDKIEGKGFFTKEIEEALLNHTIDIAVHSHKDLETEQPSGLVIAAVSPRADARELLLVRESHVDLHQKLEFRHESIVGTSSARRKAQLIHLRPDVKIKDIRGNVPTRVNKLRDGEFDAILLAKAGVDRLQLDLSGLHVQALDEEMFVPAPAQGVLAIQCRESDHDVVHTLNKISDEAVREIIRIERTVLNRLQGGCQLPLGIHAQRTGDLITVNVAIAKTWDSPLSSFAISGTNSDDLITEILNRIESKS